MPRPKSKRNDEPVKVDAEVLKMARLVVQERDTTLAEYLSELLRPLVRRDWEIEVGKLAKRAGKK
jgi:hypothetical protein